MTVELWCNDELLKICLSKLFQILDIGIENVANIINTEQLKKT